MTQGVALPDEKVSRGNTGITANPLSIRGLISTRIKNPPRGFFFMRSTYLQEAVGVIENQTGLVLVSDPCAARVVATGVLPLTEN